MRALKKVHFVMLNEMKHLVFENLQPMSIGFRMTPFGILRGVYPEGTFGAQNDIKKGFFNNLIIRNICNK